MGQLLAGLLLGPSLFGALWPEAQHALFPAKREQKAHDRRDLAVRHPDAAAARRHGDRPDAGAQGEARGALDLGRRHRRSRSPAASRSASSCRESMLPHPEQRLVTSLFLGTALSISSVKIVAVVVREMNFMRRNVGQVIVATAIIDDTIGWIIIAITFGLASHGSVDLGSLGSRSPARCLFLGVSFTHRPPGGLPPDPLGQRPLRQRGAGHLGDPGLMGAHGAGHPRHRRPHRARRLCGRHAGRAIADPDPADRRAAARPDHRAVHAGVLRPRRPQRRPHGPEGPAPPAPDARPRR